MVNAFASETGLTLGQVSTEDKSNEIPAVRALLELLSLKDCTVTLDAMHAQQETAQAIINQDADYVMALNVIKTNKDKGSNRIKFKQAGWDDAFLRKLIAGC